MSYYKIIRDGCVVDANNVFLKWQEKHKTLMVCQPEDGQFIQSGDQSEVYRVSWLNPAPESVGSQYDYIDAKEIDQEEYERLREILDEGEQPMESEPEQPPVVEDEQEQIADDPVMGIDEMRRALVEVRQQNKELLEQNEMLTGCLLEISEIIYG